MSHPNLAVTGTSSAFDTHRRQHLASLCLSWADVRVGQNCAAPVVSKHGSSHATTTILNILLDVYSCPSSMLLLLNLSAGVRFHDVCAAKTDSPLGHMPTNACFQESSQSAAEQDAISSNHLGIPEQSCHQMSEAASLGRPQVNRMTRLRSVWPQHPVLQQAEQQSREWTYRCL